MNTQNSNAVRDLSIVEKKKVTRNHMVTGVKGVSNKEIIVMATILENETIPEFSLKVWRPEALKTFFALSQCITEEMTVEVVTGDLGEGLVFRGMDKSHVTLIDVIWNAKNFEKFVVTRTGKFAIRTDEVYKIVKGLGKDDSVEMSIGDDNILVFKTKTSTEKMRLIEASGSETPLPKLTFAARAAILGKDLKNLINRIENASEYLTLTMTGQTINFFGKGDSGEASITLEKGMPEMPDFDLKEDTKATYDIEWLKKFLKCVNGHTVILEYSNRMPLRCEVSFDHESMAFFYLAPRVEN